MNPRFARNFKIIAAVHVALVVAWVAVAAVHSLLRAAPETAVPVALVMDAPPPRPALPAAVPERPPEPEPAPDPEPEPAPEPAPRRKPIKVSQEKIVRKVDAARPPAPALRPEQIKSLIGLPESPPAAVPNDDARCLEIIRRTLYGAWSQPPREAVGDAVARASITLSSDGRVVGRALVSPSGSAALDGSVMQALQLVRRVVGLSDGFLRRNREVTVSFKIE